MPRAEYSENIVDNKMKLEYDFSHAVRGKFYRKGAELRLPILPRQRNAQTAGAHCKEER
jgi:hypothetical protein